METIYEKFNGKTDVPHRHDYYTVLLVEKAKGTHTIDYHHYPFSSHQVFFVSPGQVHQVHTTSPPTGFVITFSKDFLVENSIPESFISNLHLFRQFGENPPLELDKIIAQRLSKIATDMQTCMPMELRYRNRALGALLQLFLIYCNNSRGLDTSQLDEENSGICMLRNFKQSIEYHFREWHKVSDYTSEIHVSPKHLSATIKSLTGKTAKQLIQDRLILESKRLILHTDLTIKEIAYQIGFEAPLHFSSFFKKRTGSSPTHFRNNKN